MADHHWDVVFVDGHRLAFEAESLEACSGSGVLRAADAAQESVVLVPISCGLIYDPATGTWQEK